MNYAEVRKKQSEKIHTYMDTLLQPLIKRCTVTVFRDVTADW